MKLLFVVNNFSFGGPQKSLINLLYELEGQNVDVDLMIMNQQNYLIGYLPRYVNIVPVNRKITLLMLDKHNIISNIMNNWKNPIMNFKVMLFILKSKLKLHDTTKAKQTFWINNKWEQNNQYTKYDYAIGVSGGHSIYFIKDFINAKHKIGWIRTDYKVLKRNNELDKQYFEKMDGMLAVSNMTAKNFEKLFNIKPHVFYNSLPIKLYENIPQDSIDIIPNNTNICTISRLDNGKGLDLLIDTAKLIKTQNLNIKWYVVGTGKLKSWFDNEIKTNELEDVVIPLGFKFNTGSIIKKMDILVHPSRFEGKSNTIDEALYYNIPIVATNFETVYEQITDSVNGYIVQMNGLAIFEKIKLLHDSNDTYQYIQQNLVNQQRTQQNKGQEFIEAIEKIGAE